MNRIIFLITVIITVLISCGSMDALTSTDTEDGIQYPRVPSIIPLRYGSNSTLKYNLFDDSGIINSTNFYLKISINNVFAFLNDSAIIPYHDTINTSAINKLLFDYSDNISDTSFLLSYDSIGSNVDGVYRYGIKSSDSINLFNEPKLWLKYPGQKGDVWQYTAIDNKLSEFEIISVNESVTMPSSNNRYTQPVEILQCYLYKSTKNGLVEYFYYNNNYGLVGYLVYENDILRVSAKLTDYN